MRVLAVLLIFVLAGAYWWWALNRHPAVSHRGASEERLPPDLERWLGAGLLSREQTDAIVSFEEDRVPARRIPLFAEALGYIGAVLALAGGGVAIGQVWEDLSDPAHAGIFATGAITALLAGSLIRSQSEPAMQRMLSVLWVLSVAGIGAALEVVFVDVADISEDARAVAIGGASAIYASLLWRYHRRILQQVAVFATGLATIIGLAIAFPGEVAGWVPAIVVWGYGAAWLALGWYELTAPPWGALVLGAIVGIYGPTLAAEEHGWLLGLGLASGASLMILSISGRRLPLLAIGGVGSFAYLTGVVVRYFGDTLGIPLALAMVGVLVLGLAVAIGRSGTFGGTGWRHPAGHPVG